MSSTIPQVPDSSSILGVTAYDGGGQESDMSNLVNFDTPPGRPTIKNIRVTITYVTSPSQGGS